MMNKPCEFFYDASPLGIRKGLPEDCLYRFAGAQHARSILFPSTRIFTQQLNFRPFYLELFEFHNQHPFRLTYRITEAQHFFCFILHGRIDFAEPGGPFIGSVRAGYFTLAYHDCGLYRMKLAPGTHVVLCIALQPDWLRFVAGDLPVVGRYVQDLEAGGLPYAVAPYCNMDRELRSWLRNVYSGLSKGAGSSDGTLRLYVSRALEKYDLLAGQKLRSPAFRVKEYLDAHFSDADLNSGLVARHFERSERSLRNLFKSEFNITVRDYYTSRRISHALRLMQREHLPVADVFYRVGYNNESTFRYEMKQYQRRAE